MSTATYKKLNLYRHLSHHVWQGSRRCYRTPTGEVYPGVTTVLGATKSEKDRAGLERWKASVGEDEADRICKVATDRGTAMHTRIEHQLAPHQVSAAELSNALANESANAFFDSMGHVLADVTDPILIEGTIWHPSGFAGSADALAYYQGELTLLDWKTASKPKRQGWIDDYKCQAAAYCAGMNRVYQSQGLRLGRAAIAVALADRPAQVFVMESAELCDYWRLFQERLVRYQGSLEVG
jgi:genome maintenance exonuclease 1